jgi:hypothetical protein
MAQLTITIDDDLLAAAREYVRQRGQTVEELIISLVRAAVMLTSPVELPQTIVTRDPKGFAAGALPVLSPPKALARLRA